MRIFIHYNISLFIKKSNADWVSVYAKNVPVFDFSWHLLFAMPSTAIT